VPCFPEEFYAASREIVYDCFGRSRNCGSQFVLNQVQLGYDRHRLIGKTRYHPVPPSRIEVDPVDKREVSIRTGSTPIWKIKPGVVKSSTVRS
jgi:hypothetical protein